MKRLLPLFLFILLLSTQNIYAQDPINKLQNTPSQVISIQKTFTADSIIDPFRIRYSISGLVISADIVLNSDTSLVRVILRDDNYSEYLVYEAYPLLNGTKNISITESGEETTLLDNVDPHELIIEIKDASIYLKEITVSRADGFQLSQSRNIRAQQQIQKIRMLNENLKNRNLPWIAGETSFSKLTYQEKKAYFGGELPNLYGFEYYTGGIFVVPGATSEETQQDILGETENSPFVKKFDWRNRHGINWLSPVKNQSQCGSCWAFAAVGATEHAYNLYFNQKIDPDLSEQHIVSCSGAGSCDGGWTYLALNYIKNQGVADEDCFSYTASEQDCSEKCASPAENVRIEGARNYLLKTTDNFKRIIIEGPAAIGIIPWNHALTLAGYKTLAAGDRIHIRTSSQNTWVTIDNQSELIGKTAWLVKNSWGTNWGDEGYAWVLTNMNDISSYHTCQVYGSVSSTNRDDLDILCTDNDGDGYYYWGTGPKPAHCPESPDEPDGDDSNPCLGPMDSYGNIQSFSAPKPEAGDISIIQGEPVPDLTATGIDIKWYSDYDLTQLIHSGASFSTGKTEPGIYTYYVTQTISDCESLPKMVNLTIFEEISPPLAENVEVCQGNNGSLVADGQLIKWYSDSELTTLVGEGRVLSPGTDIAGLYDFYVTQTVNGVESSATHVTFKVKYTPMPVIAEDRAFCEEPGLYLHADGDNITWYTSNYPDQLFDSRNNRYYNIVTLGNQVWMAENLDIGTMLQGSETPSDNGEIEKFYYDDDTNKGNVYGGLYTWNELMNYSTEEGSQGICPDGWHVPSHEEWIQLEIYLGMDEQIANTLGLRGTNEGTKLKQGGSSGFEALLAGKKSESGSFENLGYYATFWNSSGYTRTLSDLFEEVYASSSDGFENAFSVRCVMDDTAYVKSGNKLSLDNYQAGEHTIFVTNTKDGCESDPEPITLNINEIPSPPLTDDVEICKDEEIALLQADGSNIKWYDENLPASFTDSRNSKEYSMLKLGNQVWMGENLDIGTQINGTLEQTDNSVIEKYSYSNDPANSNTFGGLYQWDEMMNYSSLESSRGICPEGWHIPSREEWKQLEQSLGMNQSDADNYGLRGTDQGKQLREGGSSGFDALMAGKRKPDGSFASLNNYTTYWTSSGENRTLSTLFDEIYASDSDDPSNGFSVRCVMDASLYISEGSQLISEYSEPGTYVYTVTQTVNGCESEPIQANLTITAPPSPPEVTNLVICEGETVPDLTATGQDLKWYDNGLLETLLNSGPLFSTGKTQPGTYTYYVTQSNTACESTPAEISLEIKPKPESPVVQDATGCIGEMIPSLSAQGTGIKWYSDAELNNLAGEGENFDTGETGTGIYKFYVTQEINGCESDPDTAMLQIYDTPSAPLAEDKIGCENGIIPDLSAEGQDIKWYSDELASILLHEGDFYATGQTELGTYTYYATRVLNGCESYTSEVTLSINPIPADPRVFDEEICEGETVPDLTAEGDNLKWYDDLDMNNLVNEGPVFTTGKTDPGVYYYYVTQEQMGCASVPSLIKLQIFPIPPPPTTEDFSICEYETIPPLSANGLQIKWYKDEELTQLIATGDEFETGHYLPGSYSYYATQAISGCESPGEMTTLTIKSEPDPPLVEDVFVCENDNPPTLEAEGLNIKWFEDPAGETMIYRGRTYIPGQFLPGDYDFYLTQSVDGCESDIAHLNYSVNAVPPPPDANSFQVCEGDMIPDLVADGTNIKWYNNAFRSILLYKGNPFNSGDINAGSYDYYATQTVNFCESDNTLVTLDIFEYPAVDLGPDTTITQNNTILYGPFDNIYDFTWQDGSSEHYFMFEGSMVDPGDYRIDVEVFNEFCLTSDSVIITVEEPNGILDFAGSSINMYPNPTPSQVNLEFNREIAEDLTIYVFNMHGKMIRNYNHHDLSMVNNNVFQINLEKPGVYIIRLVSGKLSQQLRVVRY